MRLHCELTWLATIAVLWFSFLSTPSSAQTERTLQSEANSQERFDVVYMTSDNRYVIGCTDNRLAIWEPDSGREVYSSDSYTGKMLYDKKENRLVYFNSEQSAVVGLSLNASSDEWKPQRIFGGFQYLQLMAISDDGRLLAATGEGGFIVIDTATKKTVFRKQIENLSGVAFSPNGLTLAVSFQKDQQALVTYSITDGKKAADSAAFLSDIYHIVYSPDGDSIAASCVSGGKNTVTILDSQKLRPRRGATIPTEQYPSSVRCAWSSDGARMVVTGAAQSEDCMTIIDTTNYQTLTTLRGSDCNSVQFDKSGERLITCSQRESGVLIWDWQSALRFQGPVRTVATHPIMNVDDSRDCGLSLTLAPGEESFLISIPRLKDSNDDNQLKIASQTDYASQIDFSRVSRKHPYIFLYDFYGKAKMAMSSNTREFVDQHNNEIEGSSFHNLSYSPDGKHLASLYGWMNQACHLVVWDMAAKGPRVSQMIKMASNGWNSGWLNLHYLNNQTLLMLPANHSEKVVQVIDLETSSLKQTINGKFSKSLLLLSNNRFASGFSVWDYKTHEELCRPNDQNDFYRTLLAQGPGELLVGISDDQKQLSNWDLETSQVNYSYAAHRGYSGNNIYALATSPTGTITATGSKDHLIRVWDTASGRLLVTLRGHQLAVDALVFKRDGKTLVSASRDGTTRLWDLSTLATGPTPVAAQLPTHRAFDVAKGVRITVSFDRPASEAQIAQALEMAKKQIQN
jgi:WD40 repeat protein